MSPNRRNSMLVAGLFVLLIGRPALAQDLREANPFAQADLSSYGSGPQPGEGYFFVFDGLNWSVSSPEVTSIGFPDLTRRVFHRSEDFGVPAIEEIQANSHHTGPLRAESYTVGQRIELGRVDGRHGWFVSTYRLNPQTQSYSAGDVDIVFQDVEFGAQGRKHLEGWLAHLWGYLDDAAVYSAFEMADLPVSFDEMLVENRVETWGVELMGLCRTRQAHRGGFFELFAGVRYLEFDEQFHVDARGVERLNVDGDPIAIVNNSRYNYDQGPDNDPGETNWSPIAPGNVLADSNWTTEAENHVIGPQIGARWFRQRGRLTLSAEGRFFAGFNLQNIRNVGVLGDKLNSPQPFNWALADVDGIIVGGLGVYPYVPILREPYNFEHSEHILEWSPAAELRAELKYQITQAVFVKVGWTGFWMDGIARASNVIDYTISETSVMGINTANNRQALFIHGLNVGLTVNR